MPTSDDTHGSQVHPIAKHPTQDTQVYMVSNRNHTPTQDHTGNPQAQGTVSAGERSDTAPSPSTQLSVLPCTDPERSEGDWNGRGGLGFTHACDSVHSVSVASRVSYSYLPPCVHKTYGT